MSNNILCYFNASFFSVCCMISTAYAHGKLNSISLTILTDSGTGQHIIIQHPAHHQNQILVNAYGRNIVPTTLECDFSRKQGWACTFYRAGLSTIIFINMCDFCVQASGCLFNSRDAPAQELWAAAAILTRLSFRSKLPCSLSSSYLLCDPNLPHSWLPLLVILNATSCCSHYSQSLFLPSCPINVFLHFTLHELLMQHLRYLMYLDDRPTDQPTDRLTD